MSEKLTVYDKLGVQPEPPTPNSEVGLALGSMGKGVLHGLRHPAQFNSNGWFIWQGEYSDAVDFFSPICIEHLEEFIDRGALAYLDLPPGYRFLIDGEYLDIWFDEQLLKME